jgi:hypothetical protein
MNCHDIRQLMLPVSRGERGLTEWALVEAHVKRCAGCRAEQERVDREVAASRVIPRTFRAVSGSFARLTERIPRTASDLTPLADRLGRELRVPMARAADLLARRADLRPWISAESARAHARFRTARSIVHERARRRALELFDLGHAHLGRARTTLRGALSIARARAARAREAATPTLVSISQIKALQVAGIALAVGLTLYVLLPTPILRPDGGSVVTIARHGPPRPEVSGASRRGSDPAPPRPAVVRSAALAATTSAQHPRQAGPHVVGRLTVKDRESSEQEVAALLARSGGARIGGRHELAATIVDAVIPSSGYRKFVRGLAQIGSWQVEAERVPLPRGVRMTIRMAD